jgi:hypothetical protein
MIVMNFDISEFCWRVVKYYSSVLNRKKIQDILKQELQSLLHGLPICLPGKHKYFLSPITYAGPPPAVYFIPLFRSSRNLTFRAVILTHNWAKTADFVKQETWSHSPFHSFEIRREQFYPRITDTKNVPSSNT